ncbi:MAG: heme-binding domain-containing protein [Verrucomicrobia bacterium]|nr:heme-binding domain-containing protein [Verrucomicrobiota bacterium]
MKRYAKWFLIVLAAGLLLIQFLPGHSQNPPVTPGRDLIESANPPPPVAALLRAACYDCHSHETKWPWFDRVAPVSWWVAGHIKDGRKHLNFSDWPPADPCRAKKKLGQIAEEVTEGGMPLPSYTWMHPAARLSAADKKLLADWAEAEAAKINSGDAADK